MQKSVIIDVMVLELTSAVNLGVLLDVVALKTKIAGFVNFIYVALNMLTLSTHMYT